jgi:hypothetical protein
LFPVVLDNLVPADPVCRLIDAFVCGLAMAELGFDWAEAAEAGRPGYDPRDLLKLYLFGYLHTLRLGGCIRTPSRSRSSEAVIAAGSELVRFARGCGLIRGEWIAIDGAKFRAVARTDSVRERQALERYLDGCEKADEEAQPEIDPSAVQAALDKLRQHPEPEARRMSSGGRCFAPA